jgi:hypothetical protein
MTLDQIIGIFGQVATWFTLILVFLTLQEMGKQRRSAQKPELIIPRVSIYGYTYAKTKFIIPRVWRDNKLENNEKHTFSSPKITIYNIGFGAAKNIKLKWKFDLENILIDIKEYCYQNSIPIVVGIRDNLLHGEYPGSGFNVRTDEVFPNVEHEYLMPVSVNSQGLESDLPFSFMQLLSILVYKIIHRLDFPAGATFEKSPFQIPNMSLKLTYNDISGKEYKTEFQVRCSISDININFHDTNLITGLEVITSGAFEFVEKGNKLKPNNVDDIPKHQDEIFFG